MPRRGLAAFDNMLINSNANNRCHEEQSSGTVEDKIIYIQNKCLWFNVIQHILPANIKAS